MSEQQLPANGDLTGPTLTSLLQAAAKGDAGAAERVYPLVYQELKSLARKLLSTERKDHTLQPTALVNEAYLRLGGNALPGCESRAQFFQFAATAMRRILTEHARARAAAKRGGEARRVSFSHPGLKKMAATGEPEEILALSEAISRLEEEDAVAGQVVLLRFFAGLSIEEVAVALKMAPRTVKREWAFARAWLFRELKRDS